MDGQIGLNLDRDGSSRCIKACYTKTGLANFIYHPNDGFGATCVLEYDYDEEKEAKRKRK